MIDIYIVHDNPLIVEKVWKAITEFEPFIHFMDIGSKLDRSKAFKFKAEWGARANPFCLIEEDGTAVKAFYTETGEDAIEQMLKFIDIWKMRK